MEKAVELMESASGKAAKDKYLRPLQIILLFTFETLRQMQQQMSQQSIVKVKKCAINRIAQRAINE